MKALILNCTLKASPSPSNTEALAQEVADALTSHAVDVTPNRVVDHETSAKTGRTAAANLVAVASALSNKPMQPPE